MNTAKDSTIPPLIIPTRFWDVYEATRGVVVTRGPRGFSLQDVAPLDEWSRLIDSNQGHFLVGGGVSGALDGLRVLGAVPDDIVSSPGTVPGSAVTAAEITLAKALLADGLRRPRNLHSELGRAANAITARGWLSHPVRITSMILALVAVGSHAGNKARAHLV